MKNETRLMNAIAEAMNRLDGVLMTNHSTYELNLAASEVSTKLHAVYHGATWEAAGLEEGERDE